MTRKEAEDRIRDKLLEIQQIMRQVDGGNMMTLYCDVSENFVRAFQYNRENVKTLEIWKGKK